MAAAMVGGEFVIRGRNTAPIKICARCGRGRNTPPGGVWGNRATPRFSWPLQAIGESPDITISDIADIPISADIRRSAGRKVIAVTRAMLEDEFCGRENPLLPRYAMRDAAAALERSEIPDIPVVISHERLLVGILRRVAEFRFGFLDRNETVFARRFVDPFVER
jgi:hypothetical protein